MTVVVFYKNGNIGAEDTANFTLELEGKRFGTDSGFHDLEDEINLITINGNCIFDFMKRLVR